MSDLAIGISNSVEEAETTESELISRISKRLADAEGCLAFCLDKKKRGQPILGDVDAEIARKEAETKSYRETLTTLLSREKAPLPEPSNRK